MNHNPSHPAVKRYLSKPSLSAHGPSRNRESMGGKGTRLSSASLANRPSQPLLMGALGLGSTYVSGWRNEMELKVNTLIGSSTFQPFLWSVGERGHFQDLGACLTIDLCPPVRYRRFLPLPCVAVEIESSGSSRSTSASVLYAIRFSVGHIERIRQWTLDLSI